MHPSPFDVSISLLFLGVVVVVSAQGIPPHPSVLHGHHRHGGHHRHRHHVPQNGIPKQIVPGNSNGGQVDVIASGIVLPQVPQNGITKDAVPGQSSGGAQVIINSNVPPQVPQNGIPKEAVPGQSSGGAQVIINSNVPPQVPQNGIPKEAVPGQSSGGTHVIINSNVPPQVPENSIPKQAVPEKPSGGVIINQLIDTAKFFGIAILGIASNSNPLLFAQEIVVAHNWVRIKYNLPLFTWDEKLASYARQYAMQRYNDCAMLHSGGPYGENLFWGEQLRWRGTDAVYYWYKEQDWYNFSTLTCSPPEGKSCGHFTQIVWRDSLRIGCARQDCRPDLRGMLIVCEYDPPGNYENENPLLNNNAKFLDP